MKAESPIIDTVWMRCFYEVYEERMEAGKNNIPFDDVDKLLLEKSKSMTIEEFIKWLTPNKEEI